MDRVRRRLLSAYLLQLYPCISLPQTRPATTAKLWQADEAAGVAGTGLIDDRRPLQELLNRAGESGGGVVLGGRGKRYLIEPTPNAAKLVGTAKRFFGLEIPSGVVLDLQGGTIVAKPETDYVLISNRHTEGASGDGRADERLGLANGTVDFRHASRLGHAQAVAFYGVRGLSLDRLEVCNGFNIALDLESCTNVEIGSLVFTSCFGAAFYAGGAVRSGGGRIRSGRIDSIVAYGTRDHPSNPGLPGNPVLLNAEDLVLRQVSAFDSDAGIKVTDGKNIRFHSVLFSGGTKQNSGFKLQGANDAQIVENVIADEVVCRDCVGSGLFLTWCRNVRIGKYVGYRNGQSGKDSDVILAGEGIRIDQLDSTLAGRFGVEMTTARGLFWSGTPSAHVAKMYLDRPSSISARDAAAVAVVEGVLEVETLNVHYTGGTPRSARYANVSRTGRFEAREMRGLSSP